MTPSLSIRRAPRRAILSLSIVASLAGLAACGKSDDSAPLAFVPAQTPYVFANFEPIDNAVVESWTRMAEPIRTAYAETLARARAKLQAGGETPEKTQRILALMELFEDKLSLEGWEKIGFSREARAAIYGVGVMPVIRTELADPDALRAFIADVQTRLGETLPVAEIDGQSYWRIVPDESKPIALVIAIIDSHLVVTLDPGSANAPLADLLGLNRPTESMLDSDELAGINKAYDFGPHGTVLVDMRRLAGAMFGAEGQTTWFTQMLADDGKTLSPACQTEFTAMAENVPRLVGGYTRLDANSMDSRTVIELKPALAQGLMPIAAPVPGLGSAADGSAALEFGFGLKLDKLAEFIQAQASAIRSAPYTCEHLLSMNQGAEQVGQQMAGLYMAAGWFTGMRAVVTEFTWSDDGKPDTVEGAMVIASPNPAGLIGMLQGFVPQLAELNLVANADPVPVALGEMAGMGEEVPPTFAAMSDAAIGIGVGAASQAALKGYLAAPAAEPAPLMHIGYDGAFYGRMMKQIEAMTGARAGIDGPDDAMDDGSVGEDIFDGEDIDGGIPAGDGIESPGAGDAIADGGANAAGNVDDIQDIFEPMMESINAMYDAIDYTATDVIATERGIEMRQVLRLK